MCPIFIIFSELIHIQGHLESIRGVTKLRNKIYVLKKHRYALLNTVILVFEDRTPFRHLRNIKMERVKSVFDIGSNEKENYFYVADGYERCVWKITKGADDKYSIIIWVTTDYVLRQNTQTQNTDPLSYQEAQSTPFMQLKHKLGISLYCMN